MSRLYLVGCLLGTISLSGCHVVERARQCSALAETLEKAGKEIGSALPESPSAEQLETKAAQYGKLGDSVKALSFKNQALAKQQEELAQQLQLIKKELAKAADARKEPAPKSKEPPQAVEPLQEPDHGKKQRGRPDEPSKQHQKRAAAPRSSANLRRQENAQRRYAQASRAIEGSHVQIQAIVKRVSDLCRD